MKTMQRLRITVVCVALLIFSGGVAQATPVAEVRYTEEYLGNEIWEYNYTFSNLGDKILDSDFGLGDILFPAIQAELVAVVDLPRDATGNLTWDAIFGGGTLDVFSLIPGVPPEGADIAPGSSLAGFIFQFDRRVGNLEFDAAFYNPNLEDPLITYGTASPVPEPATLFLMAAGLGGLGFARLRRGKKR